MKKPCQVTEHNLLKISFRRIYSNSFKIQASIVKSRRVEVRIHRQREINTKVSEQKVCIQISANLTMY